MSGPNSAPNGDTTIVCGHINEVFVCESHYDKQIDKCLSDEWQLKQHLLDRKPCVVVPLRWYLLERKRLVTGKTK